MIKLSEYSKALGGLKVGQEVYVENDRWLGTGIFTVQRRHKRDITIGGFYYPASSSGGTVSIIEQSSKLMHNFKWHSLGSMKTPWETFLKDKEMTVKEYLQEDPVRIKLLKEWLEMHPVLRGSNCPRTIARDHEDDSLSHINEICERFCKKVFTKIDRRFPGRTCPCTCKGYTEKHVVKKVEQWIKRAES